MSSSDRQKWNARYTTGYGDRLEPSRVLTQLDKLLPRQGHALDVAGGDGRHAVWLAERGLDVTVADISEVGLSLATERATSQGLSVRTLQIDLETEIFPPGPWDLVVSILYLWRPLFRQIIPALRPGGMFVVTHPTRRNLQRHARPPAQYLLEDGELLSLIEELEVLQHEEGWLADGRHDALVVARRPLPENGGQPPESQETGNLKSAM